MAARNSLVLVSGLIAELPAGDTLIGIAGAGVGGIATITPNTLGGVFEWIETVAALGVTAASRIILGIGAHGDTDENDVEMLDVRAYSAVASEGFLTITATFSELHSGPIRFNWSAL